MFSKTPCDSAHAASSIPIVPSVWFNPLARSFVALGIVCIKSVQCCYIPNNCRINIFTLEFLMHLYILFPQFITYSDCVSHIFSPLYCFLSSKLITYLLVNIHIVPVVFDLLHRIRVPNYLIKIYNQISPPILIKRCPSYLLSPPCNIIQQNF